MFANFMNPEEQQVAAVAPPPVPEPAPEPDGGLVMPKSPLEQVLEKEGKGKALGKMALTALSGGLLAPVLMPELIGAGRRYETEMDLYEDELAANRMAEKLGAIDFDNLKPEDIAILDAASTELGNFGTDMLAAQMSGTGGDADIASHFGYDPYQWSKLGTERKKALTNQYMYETGKTGYFDAQLAADGKTPEQLQAAKEGELYGSAMGQQLGDDRQILTSAQSTVQGIDQNVEKLNGLKTLVAETPGSTGWNKIFRDVFNVNTKADGTLAEAEASGVVQQIQQATFGAISKAELDLLKQALMDPSKSAEYNIGLINAAIKRNMDKRDSTISIAQQAAKRYSSSDTQTDYDSLMEDDWLFQNVGEGSRIKPIVFMQDGEEKTVTFAQYYNARKEQAGPYDDLSREQILVDYRKAREAEKELWEKQQKVKADLQEEARRALELEFME